METPNFVREQLHFDQRALTKRGMALKAASGGLNGKAPLGYVNERRGCEAWIEIDPDVAPLIRDTFALLETGLSLRPALAQMTSRGLRTKAGKPLAIASFQQLVTNPIYAGFIRFEDELHKGNHEALVSPERFWKIQGRLAERRKR